MQALEEESQLYFSANEWESVGTILQLLTVLFEAFEYEKDVFPYFEKAGQMWNVCAVYIFPIAFNAFVQLMISFFFYQMKIQMKIRF